MSNGQKVIFQLQLKTEGTSGHASMPTSDNPNVKLLRALGEVTKWETPFKILPMVKEYFSKIAPKQSPEDRPFYEDIEKALDNPTFAKKLTSNPIYNAMVRDTVVLTVLQGGSKANVIPSESSATFDCRLIPGTSKEDFLKEIKRRLGEGVEIKANPFCLPLWIPISIRPFKSLPPRMIRDARSFPYFFPEPQTVAF
jgi:acetylornithine deacetylase/succinyl-diaminopimelate desuccinylase-like protein